MKQAWMCGNNHIIRKVKSYEIVCNEVDASDHIFELSFLKTFMLEKENMLSLIQVTC